MAENVESVTVEILRGIRAELAALRTDVAGLRDDNKGIHARLDQMDETMKAGFNGMTHWLETISRSLVDDRFGEMQGRLTVLENRVFRRTSKPKRH